MSSEYYVFQDGGKDNAARRTLFGTFIGLVAPDLSEAEKASLNIDFEQDRHFAGFRKSAGIWYRGEKREICWDRRLVLWLRARADSYLPFYDTEGKLVTVNGKPLSEAAVCTLEIVLRNTASYTIGFLLLPKYKRHQDECISKASSWLVLGHFPFPKGPAGTIRRVDGCELNQDKVKALLLENMPQRSDSGRVSAREGDSKPSSSCVTAAKRSSNNPIETQKKRRNLVSTVVENDKMFSMQYLVAPTVPTPKTESVVSYTLETCSGLCDSKGFSKDVCSAPSSSSSSSSMMNDPYFWNRQQCFMWSTQDGSMYPLIPSQTPSCEAPVSSSTQPAETSGEGMVKLEKDEKEDDGYVLADSWNYYEDDGVVFPFGDSCCVPGSSAMMADEKEENSLPMMWSPADDSSVFSGSMDSSPSSDSSSPFNFQGSETETVAESVVQQPSPCVPFPSSPDEMRDPKEDILPFGDGSSSFWRCGSSTLFNQSFMADSGSTLCPMIPCTTPTPLFPRSDSASLQNQTSYQPDYSLFGFKEE